MPARDGTDDPELMCSICLDILYEPLTLQCGHTFCRVCLLQSTKLAPDGRSCPQCRAVISSIRDPLTHPADESIAAKVAASVPATQIEERKVQSEKCLEALTKQTAEAIPVFIMRSGGNFRPGAPINLHFFEPRYRILIRRAWEGERRFLWAERTPSPADVLHALLVSVEDARFLPDGRAHVTGRGVELVTANHCWIEEGTGGLWYASTSTPENPADRSAAATRFQPTESTANRLRAAISDGAPAYNRGEVRRCANIYLEAARAELLLLSSQSVPSELHGLREAVAQAEALLGGASSEQQEQVSDAAAWVLRHAFDAVLAASTARSHRISSPSPSRAVSLIRELPIFYFGGLHLGVGARAEFSLFEPRYIILAEEAAGGLLICASVRAGSVPCDGQAAVVARMQACVWDESADGRVARVSLVGVHVVSLDGVREDVGKAGLWYARVEASGAQGEGLLTTRRGRSSTGRARGCAVS